jgi:hypothetical protein
MIAVEADPDLTLAREVCTEALERLLAPVENGDGVVRLHELPSEG